MSPRPRRTLQDLGEFGFIRRIQRQFARPSAAILRGIGEDTALVRPSPGHLLLLTTDLLLEGVHFDLATATAEDIGYKAAVANLSDIAAMGGVPQYLLVSLAAPARTPVGSIEKLYAGLMRACRRHGALLIGGDTSSSKHGLFIHITLTGAVEPNRALRRDGASIGDLIFVTGSLGDSLAGWWLLTGPRGARRRPRGLAARHVRRLIQRHLRPVPRVKAGRALSTHRLATAAIDLSDGLSGDLGHLCAQSGVGAEIDAARLPLSVSCRAFARAEGIDPVQLGLAGGEDYELLFTVPAGRRARLERLAYRLGTRLTCIGRIEPKARGIRVRGTDHRREPLPITSYRHFSSTPTLA